MLCELVCFLVVVHHCACLCICELILNVCLYTRVAIWPCIGGVSPSQNAMRQHEVMCLKGRVGKCLAKYRMIEHELWPRWLPHTHTHAWTQRLSFFQCLNKRPTHSESMGIMRIQWWLIVSPWQHLLCSEINIILYFCYLIMLRKIENFGYLGRTFSIIIDFSFIKTINKY